jgi:hypothetical protein
MARWNALYFKKYHHFVAENKVVTTEIPTCRRIAREPSRSRAALMPRLQAEQPKIHHSQNSGFSPKS